MGRNSFRQEVVFEVVDKASAKAKGIASSFDQVKKAVAGLAVFAGVTRLVSKFVAVLNKASVAAAVQEKAIVKLDIALGRTGSVKAYSAALQAQAAELQKLGTAGDEAIIGTQALLIEMGVAPARMKEATEATLNLSAAFGISLEQAARNVGRTIGGLAGELGELIPELKTMQAEGRLAGEGIEFLNQKFAGAAAGTIDTYENALKRLNDTMGDTAEALGKGQNDAGVVFGMNQLATEIRLAGSAIEDSGLSDGLGFMKEALLVLEKSFVQTGVAIGQWSGFLRSNQEIAASRGEEMIRQNEITRAATIETTKLAAAEAFAKDIARERLEAIVDETKALLGIVDAEVEFLDAVVKLGVVLESDVNVALEDNVRLLEDADEQLRRGLITRQDFENITRAVSESERELQAEFEGTSTAVQQFDADLVSATDTVAAYATTVDGATLATQRFGGATATASRSTGGGSTGSSGLVARDSRNQALADRGGTVSSRGTRLNVRGGGSILLREA